MANNTMTAGVSTPPHPSLASNPVKPFSHGKAVAILLLGTMFLSGTPLWVKGSNMDPATQAFLRVSIGFLLLLPFGIVEMRKKMVLPKKGIMFSCIAGLFLGLDFTNWNFSIFLIGSGVAAILLNLQVVIVPILTTIFDKYKLPKSFIVILPLMIVGVLFTGGVFEPAAELAGPAEISGIKTSVLGTACGLTSGICYSFYLYFSRKAGVTAPRNDIYVQPMMFTMLAQCVVPTIIMIIGNGFNITTGVLVEDANGQMVLPELPEGVGLFEAVSQGDPIDGGNWVHLISLIVLGQAMAWTFVQMGTVWLEPVLSAGILLLSPVTSVIIAWPLFGEIPSWLQWLGVVIILGCVMFQNGMFDPLLGKKKKEEPVVAETVNEAAGPAH
ncbi:DMT(drug/metabolite transporter) superfamily permease [Corynebacterium singulare]|uniref:DMT(Drug/metabolite transporter) superfamily permease n=2 Tax=Corynebacterium singulare TaxID=161899 RepID=A0A0B6EU12_9CORY|nr:DMT(drug/metabolite transporter) superfamily permease [Corynebacterium singulare]